MPFQKFKISDDAYGRLGSSISTTTTTITLKSSQNLQDQNCIGTLVQYGLDGYPAKKEKVFVSLNNSNVLTVTRGYDGDTAQTFNEDDYIFFNVVSKIVEDIQDEVSRLETDKANLASPTFTGSVAVPTPTIGTDAVNKAYADGLVIGLLDYRGAYNASVNTFPVSGGSGTAGAVLKGDMWVVSVAGTLGGTAVQIGDSVISNIDTPGQTAGNWNILNSNISYVPEDTANKSTSVTTDIASNTKFPSVKSVYDWATALFSTQAYALSTPDFYKYSIVTSVASGNLTVALKNYEGNDPTPSKPVKIQIGGVIRTITSACYINETIAGTNWGNAGSAELATKEIDWFVYILDYNNSGAVFNLGISRYPLYNNLSEATGGYTGEKYLMQAGNIGIENVVNIGRFAATLSAGAGYTWSIGTSVIINSPCYETRLLDWLPTVSGSGGMTVTGTIATQKYRLVGNIVFLKIENLGLTTGGTASTEIRFTLPFYNIIYSNNVCIVNDSGYKGSICNIQVGPTLGVSSSMTLGNWGLGTNREVYLSAQSTI